jgi:nitrite reductase/ring-hydroxylating ferredoxin subunit
MTRVVIARTDDIKPGGLLRVEVGDLALCIAHVDGDGFYAVEDRCSHEQVELSAGELLGTEVECPLHGSLFDVKTGEVCGLPADRPVQTYELEVDGHDLVAEL